MKTAIVGGCIKERIVSFEIACFIQDKVKSFFFNTISCLQETFGHFQRIFETPLLIISVLRFFRCPALFFQVLFYLEKNTTFAMYNIL